MRARRRIGRRPVAKRARYKERCSGLSRQPAQGRTNAPANAGPTYEVTRELALDPGENRIEVIAYEGRNLLALPPAPAELRIVEVTDDATATDFERTLMEGFGMPTADPFAVQLFTAPALTAPGWSLAYS